MPGISDAADVLCGGNRSELTQDLEDNRDCQQEESHTQPGRLWNQGIVTDYRGQGVNLLSREAGKHKKDFHLDAVGNLTLSSEIPSISEFK